MDSQPNRAAEPLAHISVMDRLDALVKRPKRLIVAIVALLVAGGAAVGSSAVLTTSSSNPGNSFQASNFSVTHDGNGVILNVSGLLPGVSTSAAPITITNDGDLQALMSLDVSASDTPGPNGGDLSSVLNASIVDTTNGG